MVGNKKIREIITRKCSVLTKFSLHSRLENDQYDGYLDGQSWFGSYRRKDFWIHGLSDFSELQTSKQNLVRFHRKVKLAINIMNMNIFGVRSVV